MGCAWGFCGEERVGACVTKHSIEVDRAKIKKIGYFIQIQHAAAINTIYIGISKTARFVFPARLRVGHQLMTWGVRV